MLERYTMHITDRDANQHDTHQQERSLHVGCYTNAQFADYDTLQSGLPQSKYHNEHRPPDRTFFPSIQPKLALLVFG